MKAFFHKIYRHRYFLIFVLLFGYAQSIHSRILVRDSLNMYVFTPEPFLSTAISIAILFGVLRYYLEKWQTSLVFNTKELLKIFSAALVTYVLLMRLLGFMIALAFDTVERNFNQKTFMLNTSDELLQGLIYGSFFLAYYYFNKNKKQQQELMTYHQSLAESRINQLKAQLNPHFLFNNLNVLDQLIEEDKQQASDFLNEFAEIYRYVLEASDRKLVSLQEEIEFVTRYFSLIKHKYGTAYQLEMLDFDTEGYVVPLTLQVLVENVVQHNLGTMTKPVRIKIDRKDRLCVTNTLAEKHFPKSTSGRALKNLQDQYRLLADQPLEIQKQDGRFSVIIPVISL